jgi:hypothetical protein
VFSEKYSKNINFYRGADMSLARPGRKQARKHVRDAHDFNNIETQAVIKFFPPAREGAEGFYAIVAETLACFLPGRVKDLSAPQYENVKSLTDTLHEDLCTFVVTFR